MGIERSYIYWVDFGPVRGVEKAHRRPAVVLSINAINAKPLVVVVVPGTKGPNKPRDFPWNVRVAPADSGLPLETVFQAFDVTSIDPRKVESTPIGKFSSKALERLEDALRKTLGLS